MSQDILAMVEQRPEFAPLDRPLTRSVYFSALKRMRSSSGGDDEITIDIWRSMTGEMEEASTNWCKTCGCPIPPLGTSRCVGPLSSCCGRTRASGPTCRLPRRVVSRICAQRLSEWAEAELLLEPEQWAFRPYRRTVDPTLHRRDVDAGSLCFVMCDFEKAYPNVLRELCFTYLSGLGMPEGMRRRLEGLHGSTRYVVRTRAGDSRPYILARGLQEGCASSCALFNIFPNHTLQCVKAAMRGSPVRVCSRSHSGSGQRRLHEYSVLGFADDTTGVTTVGDQPRTESILVDMLRAHGMTAHPHKFARLAVGDAGQLPPSEAGKWDTTVRFLRRSLAPGRRHPRRHGRPLASGP